MDGIPDIYRLVGEAVRDVIGFGDEITSETMMDLGIEVNAELIKSDQFMIIYPLSVKRILDRAIPNYFPNPSEAKRVRRELADLDVLDDCVVLTTVSRLVEALGGRELDDGTILENRPIPLEYPYCRMGMLCSGVRVRSELMDRIIRTAIGDPKAIVLDLDYLRSEGSDTRTGEYGNYNQLMSVPTIDSHGGITKTSALLEVGLVFRKTEGNVWRSALTLPNRVVTFENATSLDLSMDMLSPTHDIATKTLKIQSQLVAALITNVTKFGVSSDETFKINIRESGWQEVGDMEPRLPLKFLQNPLPGGLQITWDLDAPGDMHLLIRDGQLLCRIGLGGYRMAWDLSVDDLVDKDGNITNRTIQNAIDERTELHLMTQQVAEDVISDVAEQYQNLVRSRMDNALPTKNDHVWDMTSQLNNLIPSMIDSEAYVGRPYSETLFSPDGEIITDKELRGRGMKILNHGLRLMLMLQMPHYWRKIMVDSRAPNPDLGLERVLANPKNRKRRFRFGSDKIRFIYPKSDKPKKQRKYHPVRGHTRVLKNGRETQVIPHWRGNPQIGTIQSVMAIGEAKRGPWSEVALEWLRSIEERLGRKIRHHRNGGEYRIPHTNLRVDGWDEETGTIYEFHGDYWHGNPDVYPEDTPHPEVKGKTMGDLYRATMEKEQLLRDMEYRVVSVWENDWRNR